MFRTEQDFMHSVNIMNLLLLNLSKKDTNKHAPGRTGSAARGGAPAGNIHISEGNFI